MSIELAGGTEVAGRFRLSHLIGEGGMGSVWSATDGHTDRVVALKFVKDSQASRRLRRRLLREAKAACAVRHPNVVQVHDILELSDGAPVLVMELLEGESMAERLERECEIPLAELAEIMVPVVSAVGTAHAFGVVHRDLKPENVFLLAEADDGGRGVKILDFGIAKLAPSEYEAAQSTELTRTGSVMGTPCYMAPEQVYGERDIDHRADIWALGMILYEALSGILPTHAENMGQVMKIITTRRIWPLAQAAPDLPPAITDLVDRMLSRDRNQRPQDLHEVADVLARYTGVVAPEFGAPISVPSGEAIRDSTPSERRLALRLDSGADGHADTAAGEQVRIVHAEPVMRSATPPEHLAAARPSARESAKRTGTPVLHANRLTLVLLALAAGAAGWWWGLDAASEARRSEKDRATTVAASDPATEATSTAMASRQRSERDRRPSEQASLPDAGVPDPTRAGGPAGPSGGDRPTRPAANRAGVRSPTARAQAAPRLQAEPVERADEPPNPEPTSSRESLGGVVDEVPF